MGNARISPAELPAELAAPQDANDNFTYEIVGEMPKAALRAHAAASGSAKVYLADVQLAWQADGACRGAAAFDLEPGGKKSCPLNLPNGCELVHADIDGRAAAPIPNGPGKWNLPLVSARLPQRVEIVFRSKLADPLGCGRRDLAAPFLGDLSVAQTLWTVSCAPSLMFQTGRDEKAMTLAAQERIRFRVASAMIASAEKQLSPEDAEETLRWYQARTRRLYSALSAVRFELAFMSDPEFVRNLQKEIETTGQDQADFAERLGLSKAWAQAKAESRHPATRPISAARGPANLPAPPVSPLTARQR